MAEFRAPASMSADELITEARERLEELRTFTAEALESAKARQASGQLLTKQETRALNRCAQLARYIADCAHRSRLNAPRRGKARLPWFLQKASP